MPLSTPTSLFDDPDNANATNYVSPSVTPSGGGIVVLAVLGSLVAGAAKPTLDSPTWLDGIWNELEDVGTGTNHRLTVWWGEVVASPSADTVTADYGGTSHDGCYMSAVQVTGQDAATPVPQSEQGSVAAGATSGTVTLPGALAAATSVVVGFCGRNTNDAISPADGENEITDDGHGAPNRRLQSQYKVNDASSSWSFSSSSFRGVALEIKESAAATTFRQQAVMI